MKVLILNSGLGKRMGELTKNSHKSMVVLDNGETIFERQLRLFQEVGLTDIIVTTGPYKEQLEGVATKFPKLNIVFVNNPIYDQTNYIYSEYLARELLNDSIFSLHGDLVFNKELLEAMLADSIVDLCLYNEDKPLPEKDFKCRLENGLLREVSINIFDADCYAFQPLYKLSKETIGQWLKKINDYIEKGVTGVYAENALNEILSELKIVAMSYKDHYIEEIDTEEDYDRVKSEISEFERLQLLRKDQ